MNRPPLIFEQSAQGRQGFSLPSTGIDRKKTENMDERLLRRTPLTLPSVSEAQAVHHFTTLARENQYIQGREALQIPFCGEDVLRQEGFMGIHPYQPTDSAQGAVELLFNLQHMLSDMFSMAEFTFQPLSLQDAVYSACRILKAYDDKKDTLLLAENVGCEAAKGASLSGYSVVSVKTGEDGCVDLCALERAIKEHAAAGLVVSCPNCMGLPEKELARMAQMIHEAGGLLIVEAADAGIYLCETDLGGAGADMVCVSLRESFAGFSGGEQADAVALGAKEDLVPFMPVPFIDVDELEQFFFNDNRERSIGKSGCFYGNFGGAVKALTYILSMGLDGLRLEGRRRAIHAAIAAKRDQG